ncbi:hypothetical protein CHS0354_042803 [Potamilus streckersoni]|uniref:G-protein coupled receptors family 1 profile domain-containing protein n=1 Tax=Potamilus streckersoni TaxID=2493646 RepID=A0AAE0T4S2_9BIVA|nr:hypothetical protein CHS0354_042803 [Potamilus streckersoni]
MEINQTYRDVTEAIVSEDHIKFQILVGRNNSVFHYSLPALCMTTIVMVVGLACNTIMIVTYQKKLKGNSTYFFVFILAMFDVINCLMLPFEIYELRNPYMYSTFTLCKVHKFFSFASDLASGNTIVAISFDRYFRFAKPHKKFSLRKAKAIVLIVVVVSLFLCLFALYIHGEEEVTVDTKASVTGTKCGIHKEAKTTIAPGIFKVIIMVFFFGGVIVIATVYTLLWIRFKQWNRKRQEKTTVKQSNSNTGQNNAMLKRQTFTEQLRDRYQLYQSNLGLEQIDVTIQGRKINPNTEQKSNTNQDHQTYHDMEQTDGIQNKLLTHSSSEHRDVSTETYCDAEQNEEPEQKQETNEGKKQGYCTHSGTKITIKTTFAIDEILKKHNTFGHNVSDLSGSISQDESQSSNKSFSQMDNSKKSVCSTMSLNQLKIRSLVSKVDKSNVSRSKSLSYLGKISQSSKIKMMSTLRTSSISTIASFGRSLKMNRTTIMFLAATVSFAICRVPYVIIVALEALHPEAFKNMESIQTVMYKIFLNFFVLSYVINPLIYSFLNPKIRSECVGLLFSLLQMVFRSRRNNVFSIPQDSSTVVGN